MKEQEKIFVIHILVYESMYRISKASRGYLYTYKINPTKKGVKHISKCWGKEDRRTKITYHTVLFYKVLKMKNQATLYKGAYLDG